MAHPAWSVDIARRRIEKAARAMGYEVARQEGEGTVTLALFWLGPTNPHIRLVEIVPEGHPEDPDHQLAVISSGLAIPDRCTPRTVRRVLDLLTEFERSLS